MAAAALAVGVLPGTPAEAAVSFAAAPTSLHAVWLNGFEAALVTDINRTRVAHGLHPLTVAAGTTDVARRWAWHMARHESLSHNPSLARDLSRAGSRAWRMVAENVGYGPAGRPSDLFDAYMHSAPHRANILDRSATYLGVGVVERSGFAWNTLDFTDAYSARYGAPRVPADALRMDADRVARTTDLATLEEGTDQRFAVRAHRGVSASPLAFSGPSTGNDAAYTVLTARRATGRGRVFMHDALELSRASSLALQLGAASPRGHAVAVHVLLRRAFGSTARLGTVWVRPGASWASLRLPAAAKSFRTTLVLRVSGRAITRAGGRVRLSVYDIRATV